MELYIYNKEKSESFWRARALTHYNSRSLHIVRMVEHLVITIKPAAAIVSVEQRRRPLLICLRDQ